MLFRCMWLGLHVGHVCRVLTLFGTNCLAAVTVSDEHWMRVLQSRMNGLVSAPTFNLLQVVQLFEARHNVSCK